MASGADRTREKEIFGIFGFINTIKITNGKFSEVASVVLTIEIERLFLHTHKSVLEAASSSFLRDFSTSFYEWSKEKRRPRRVWSLVRSALISVNVWPRTVCHHIGPLRNKSPDAVRVSNNRSLSFDKQNKINKKTNNFLIQTKTRQLAHRMILSKKN